MKSAMKKYCAGLFILGYWSIQASAQDLKKLPSSTQSCIEKTALPLPIYGIVPPNRHWSRALMGSHQPSPEEKENAKIKCEIPKSNKVLKKPKNSKLK